MEKGFTVQGFSPSRQGIQGRGKEIAGHSIHNQETESNNERTQLFPTPFLLLCMHGHSYIKARGVPWMLSSTSPTSILWNKAFSLKLKFTAWSRLVSRKLPDLSLFSKTLVYRHRCLTFMWVLGVIWNQVLLLSQQMLTLAYLPIACHHLQAKTQAQQMVPSTCSWAFLPK